MKRKTLLALTCLLLGLSLSACESSQERRDAQATQIAGDIFATQTAEAPTPVPTSTATPLPTATPPPTFTPVPPSPQAILEAAYAALETKSCHIEMTVQMTMTQEELTIEVPIIFVMDLQPPERVKGTMSMTFEGFTVDVEMIGIGETLYVTNPETGEWEVSTDPVAPFSPEDFSAIDPADIEDLKLVGEESLDGTPVYRLEGTVSAEYLGAALAGIEGEVQVEYWIGIKDSRFRKMVMAGELSVPLSGIEALGLAATATYSDYGKLVVIEPPELPTPAPVATQPPVPTAPLEAKDLLRQVVDAGVLVVAIDPNYAPQSFLNDQGELDGFDVDLAKEVARRLGVELEFVTPDWDLVTSGNWGGRWDVSINSMVPTETRAELLWFTDPYYYLPASFAVHEDNATIITLADLAGKRVGVGIATTYEEYLDSSLERMGIQIVYDPPAMGEIVPYSTNQEPIQDLALGDGIRLDAVLSAQTTIQHAIDEGLPLKFVGTPVFYESMVFALDQSRGPSEKMLDRLNEIVADMHADGTLTELSFEWYGIDITAVQVP